MELQGYVVAALTLILLGYLLPHVVRTRQLLLESRVEDRFSGDLRIVATAGAPDTAQGRAVRSRGHTSDARPYLHDPARRPEAPMNRPRARTERATEDARALAAARAARAARVSRRAAAARRRLILTVLLLLLSAGAWTAVGLASVSWALAVLPTLLLVTVLVLGRRTAVQAASHDRRDRAEMARLEARLKAVSRRAQATPPRRTASRPAAARGAGSVTRGTSARGNVAVRPAEADGVDRTRAAHDATPSRQALVAGPGEDDVEAPVLQRKVADRDSEAPNRRTAAPPQPPSAVVTAGTVPEAVDVAARADVTVLDAAVEAEVSAAGADGTAAVRAGSENLLQAEEIVDAEVVEDDATAGPAAEEGAPEDRPWTPVPVPAPSYTLKQEAPRRDVAPYAQEDGPTAAVPQRPTVASPASTPAPAEEPVALTIDLDAVLARRRAAGE